MKIVQSIETLYQAQLPLYLVLQKSVDGIININKKSTWHYVGRIKQLESFALKIETGRFNKTEIFDDVFACTIVVSNLSEIGDAVNLIKRFFTVTSSKPNNPKYTHKQSHSFQFDDLRMYCKIKDDETGKYSEELLSKVFELQVKTFLQHAWSIATHDLIYKSDQVNWAKERIAYQVKATLEHAEVSISGVNHLSALDEINKSNRESSELNKVIRFIKKYWTTEDLPADIRRLAQNLIALFSTLHIKLDQVEEILKTETDAKRGTNTKNLSPYLITIQSIFNQNPGMILSYLRSSKQMKDKILITNELNLPALQRIKAEKVVDLRTN